MSHEQTSHLTKYLVPGKRAHLVGIGGVSMCALGMVLQGMGINVTGSDMNRSKATEDLVAKGIPVTIGHAAENIAGADCVIRTAAAHDDNPEIAAALAAGIPVFERAQSWGYIMSAYENAVCFSGTHGKTTATSMMTHIAMEAGLDPTVMIGGYLNLLGAGHRVGSGDTIIAESCEYCNSFLNFTPTIAVILDIDADHLDFFKDLEDIKHSFRQFAELTPTDRGIVIANGQDKNTMDALRGIDRRLITFGMSRDMLEGAIDEKQLKQTEAIILSMTPQERSNPKLLNPQRKFRIAKGSGCDIATVNRFIKQFNQMQKMMKQMGGMGGRRRGRNPFGGLMGGGMPGRRGGFPF